MKAFYSLKLIVVFIFLGSCVHAQSPINALDSNGKKDGIWKGVYAESKRPRYEGTFSHGKELDLFKFFDDTKIGSVIATREFNAIDNVAYTIFYDQSKNKVSEGKVLNRGFEGEWKYYHQKSAVVMTKENYSKGKLEGLRTVYYPNGKIAEEQFYKNNMKNGVYKKYAENGIILEESGYKNDQYDGTAIFKDPDGTIVSKGKFTNGKKVGIWQFFEKGKLVKEVNMNNPEALSKSNRN
jgi:antitoxin component YwqK of YwqJK toxin-antitoxin module